MISSRISAGGSAFAASRASIPFAMKDRLVPHLSDQQVHQVKDRLVVLHNKNFNCHYLSTSAGLCFGIWMVNVLPRFTMLSTLI